MAVTKYLDNKHCKRLWYRLTPPFGGCDWAEYHGFVLNASTHLMVVERHRERRHRPRVPCKATSQGPDFLQLGPMSLKMCVWYMCVCVHKDQRRGFLLCYHPFEMGCPPELGL